MAYDQHLADRIERLLEENRVVYKAKPLMGGLCFVVDEKMCVGTSIDKSTGKAYLIARIGENEVSKALEIDACEAFQPAGRVMKDFAKVTAEGIDLEVTLWYWVNLSLNFNPIVKRRK